MTFLKAKMKTSIACWTSFKTVMSKGFKLSISTKYLSRSEAIFNRNCISFCFTVIFQLQFQVISSCRYPCLKYKVSTYGTLQDTHIYKLHLSSVFSRITIHSFHITNRRFKLLKEPFDEYRLLKIYFLISICVIFAYWKPSSRKMKKNSKF